MSALDTIFDCYYIYYWFARVLNKIKINKSKQFLSHTVTSLFRLRFETI